MTFPLIEPLAIQDLKVILLGCEPWQKKFLLIILTLTSFGWVNLMLLAIWLADVNDTAMPIQHIKGIQAYVLKINLVKYLPLRVLEFRGRGSL